MPPARSDVPLGANGVVSTRFPPSADTTLGASGTLGTFETFLNLCKVDVWKRI
jgi:hypothetical protein